MAKAENNKKKARDAEVPPVDLASRIGARGADAPSTPPAPSTPAGDAPPRGDRPVIFGADEPAAPSAPVAPPEDGDAKSAPILSVRGAPAFGEIDLVVTPLPTPDDWHRFELALRKVRGITQLRPEYYRHGVAKMRVSWEGSARLASALRSGIPGYRVRVLGEDRATIQILVSTEADERRPG